MIRMAHATKADAARKTHFIRECKTRPILTFTASFLSLYQLRMSVTGTCPERQHATGNCAITIGNRPNHTPRGAYNETIEMVGRRGALGRLGRMRKRHSARAL